MKKFFGLLLKKNGYVLEQLFSPLIVHSTPEHAELKEICRSNGSYGVIISKIADDRREFEIVKVDYSPRQAAARISFSSSFGIFAFDLNPGGCKLNRLTLVVNNQRHCEGLTFQDRTGHTTDLLRLEGVHVFHQGTDLVIEIAPPAVNLLQDGGGVQYVNQYR